MRINDVHHINGIKSDNSWDNLWVTTKKEHGIAETSLKKIALELYKQKKVVFNRNKGVYELIVVAK